MLISASDRPTYPSTGRLGYSDDSNGWAITRLNLTAPTDCQRCGVCCFSPSSEYVWVNGYDWSRLGEDADRLAHFIGNRAFMKMTNGHCTALQISGKPGVDAVYCCSIYERRPEICRMLERGSPECLGDLETKGEEVRQRPPS